METKSGTELGIKDTHRYVEVPCPDCNSKRWVRRDRSVNRCCYLCAERKLRERVGAKHPHWKGGRFKTGDGYIKVLLRLDDFFYPMANSLGYVFEHRLVVAKALNRCLLPWETVHHKEGYAKDDNRYPEVLELLPSRYKHNAITLMVKYIHKLERENKKLKTELKSSIT